MNQRPHIAPSTVLRTLPPRRLAEFCTYFQLRTRKPGSTYQHFEMLLSDTSLTSRVLLSLLTLEELRRVSALAGESVDGTERQLLDRLLRRCAGLVPELEPAAH